MTNRSLIVLPLLAALSACDSGARPNARICTPFTTASAPATNTAPAPPGAPGAEATAFDECLHSWGYRLAASQGDPAESVAGAVLAACGEALSRWNAQAVSQPGDEAPAVDLHTGRTMTALEQRYDYARGKALFYVVQGRAGHCKAP